MKSKTIVLVACGGAIGAVLRYLLTFFIPQKEFAFATLTANLAGSFLLAMLTAMWAAHFLDEALRPLLGTGFCGGFTTMSTLSSEINLYIMEGDGLKSMIYLFLSLFGGLLVGWAGYAIGMRIPYKQQKGEQP
ncbi:fluoride efflux transporter FluC [Bacillus songklensis]|uniref:Fluoride-specific ion channel FluC n=1 Tax=Bacillus songklensis TaxID=1069116 RepID=A0ABV8B534_9BACI